MTFSFHNIHSTPIKGLLLKTASITFCFCFRTSFKHIPQINGKEIDLYLLYWLVTAQGGWERVGNILILTLNSIYVHHYHQHIEINSKFEASCF